MAPTSCLLLLGLAPHLAPSLAPSLADEPRPDRQAVLEGYAAFAHSAYAQCHEAAVEVRAALIDLTERPSPQTLHAARRAWLVARRLYGRTEVLRFYGGPIDDGRSGVETFLNAWPLDEAYVDYVAGAPLAGIINRPDEYPNLSPTLLTLLNERSGEANVSIGWHAVEFLLWGQDLDPEGPGSRGHEDYVPGARPNVARRSEYLRLCGDLLVEHHAQLRAAWSPEADSYRSRFLGEEQEHALRRVLAGMIILSGFELSGERLAVPYETQDQEEEHSCFSDNTHVDLLANQEGVLAVYHGAARGGRGPGVRVIAQQVSPTLAARLDEELEASRVALRGIPIPFDRAIRGGDEAPGRRAVLAALEAVERQAQTLAILARELGYEVAILPGG